MAIKGIRQIIAASKNTLLTTPVNIYSPGLSSDASHTFNDVTIKEHREAELPDKVLSTVMATSRQTQLWQLAIMIGDYSINGCDLQIVSEKENPWSPTGGVFNYTGNTRFMGFDFEYLLGGKDRSTKITGEVALDYEEHVALMQNSLVATALDGVAVGVGKKGVQPGQYRAPKFVKVDSPSGTTLVNGFELIDRKLSFKSISSKLEYNRSVLNWVQVMLELKINKANGQDLIDYFTKTRYAAIQMQERVSSSVIETFNFGEGVLWRAHNFSSMTNARDITLRFTRNIAPFDIVIDAGTHTLTINE